MDAAKGLLLVDLATALQSHQQQHLIGKGLQVLVKDQTLWRPVQTLIGAEGFQWVGGTRAPLAIKRLPWSVGRMIRHMQCSEHHQLSIHCGAERHLAGQQGDKTPFLGQGGVLGDDTGELVTAEAFPLNQHLHQPIHALAMLAE